MNSFQISTLNSYKLIVIESKKNPEAMSLIPTYGKAINRLDEITAEIDSESIQQAKDLKGITNDKQALMEELSDLVIDVAGAVHSYAMAKGDKTLQAKVNYKTHKVNIMNQATLGAAAGVVLEEAKNIPAEALAEEGITAEEMTQFADTYNQFKDTKNDKREAVIEHSGNTDRIADLFAEAASLKKNTLDRLATQFQRKAPEFYQKYKDAAIVIHKRAAKKTTEEAQA